MLLFSRHIKFLSSICSQNFEFTLSSVSGTLRNLKQHQVQECSPSSVLLISLTSGSSSIDTTNTPAKMTLLIQELWSCWNTMDKGKQNLNLLWLSSYPKPSWDVHNKPKNSNLNLKNSEDDNALTESQIFPPPKSIMHSVENILLITIDSEKVLQNLDWKIPNLIFNKFVVAGIVR